MKWLSAKIYTAITNSLNNERGAQTLEWLGVAAVIIAVVTILSTTLGDAADGEVQSIVDDIFERIGEALGG